MERRIWGVSYMCWIDFQNGIWGCGLLCTLLISFYFTANTPRATTPHLYITGYHAEGYHAPSIPHGPPRLYHHCTAITPVYIPATTPRATTPHTFHQGLSRLTTHVHRVITPAISNSYFVVFISPAFTPPLPIYTTTGRHTLQPTPQRCFQSWICSKNRQKESSLYSRSDVCTAVRRMVPLLLLYITYVAAFV